jgi:hypothetical protein
MGIVWLAITGWPAFKRFRAQPRLLIYPVAISITYVGAVALMQVQPQGVANAIDFVANVTYATILALVLFTMLAKGIRIFCLVLSLFYLPFLFRT